MGKEGGVWPPLDSQHSPVNPKVGGGVPVLGMTSLLGVWGLLLRAAQRKPCPQEGWELPVKPRLGQLLWLTEVFIMLSLHLPNPKETWQTGGEEDTQAEPSLTVSVEFYPSPSGNPGRKEKEDRHVRTPWNVIGERPWAPSPQPSTKVMEGGPLPPEDIHPPIPRWHWDEQASGYPPPPSREGWEELEGRVLGGRQSPVVKEPSPSSALKWCGTPGLPLNLSGSPWSTDDSSAVHKSKEVKKKLFGSVSG